MKKPEKIIIIVAIILVGLLVFSETKDYNFNLPSNQADSVQQSQSPQDAENQIDPTGNDDSNPSDDSSSQIKDTQTNNKGNNT
ncbi:MAG: hypothetical protein BZ135_02680 [Methanosphaera sp. rholeuAM6]|nr:MAG: hypothetical protein BZ135_02680 [Methanosphaera sp. rholeuAM6]